jgi:hypothetical protein
LSSSAALLQIHLPADSNLDTPPAQQPFTGAYCKDSSKASQQGEFEQRRRIKQLQVMHEIQYSQVTR